MIYYRSEKRLSFAFPSPKPSLPQLFSPGQKNWWVGLAAKMNLLENSPAWSLG